MLLTHIFMAFMRMLYLYLLFFPAPTAQHSTLNALGLIKLKLISKFGFLCGSVDFLSFAGINFDQLSH